MRWRWWPIGLVLVAAIQANCSGGAGSSLQACPPSNEVQPGGACTSGASCPSAAALPDCPGSTGSLACNCTAQGWVCFDQSRHECHADGTQETVVPGGACELAYAVCSPAADVMCPASEPDAEAAACTCNGSTWTCPTGCAMAEEP